MSEQMAIWVELWPVAQRDTGLWHLNGPKPERSTLPVMADSDPASEAGLMALSLDLDSADLRPISWRVEGPSMIVSYIALINPSGPVHARWPAATPLDPYGEETPAELRTVLASLP